MNNIYKNLNYYQLTSLIQSYLVIFSVWTSNDVITSILNENSSQRELLRGFFLLMQNLGFEGSKESEK